MSHNFDEQQVQGFQIRYEKAQYWLNMAKEQIGPREYISWSADFYHDSPACHALHNKCWHIKHPEIEKLVHEHWSSYNPNCFCHILARNPREVAERDFDLQEF